MGVFMWVFLFAFVCVCVCCRMKGKQCGVCLLCLMGAAPPIGYNHHPPSPSSVIHHYPPSPLPTSTIMYHHHHHHYPLPPSCIITTITTVHPLPHHHVSTTAQPLEGYKANEWVVFERALVVRDQFTGGQRTFLSRQDAKDFRAEIYR